MEDTTTHTLGDLQLAIMRVLWERGEAAAAEVHEALLAERGLAPTTIATMLAKMERKGVVAHRAEGRRFLYRPTVSEPQVRRSMVGELTERLFGGDRVALVSHLLAEHDLDPAELAELFRLTAAAEPAGDDTAAAPTAVRDEEGRP
ncbi:MAG TPA: BlaI/MecI/CopY family transcriptional regulator [Thermoanaerobaculia bacterium]|nr:BlaI/MecI/CopY family transcriptional regulator [Thermoanaerobaculia bacterium]